MLTVISPAKTLDFESPCCCRSFTRPSYLGQSRELIRLLRDKSTHEIQSLMSVSDSLALLNARRYKKWKAGTKLGDNARQAAFAFRGDVYQGLNFASLKSGDREYAQEHLRILSGLYGILRPLDLIAPHRLEMGTSLANERGRSLYAFWDDTQTQFINREAKRSGSTDLLNLASLEYFKSVKPKKLKLNVVSPRFLDSNDGKTFKVMSFYAKRARGLMARWIIENRIEDPSTLPEFKEDGYHFDETRSEENRPTFSRSHNESSPFS